MGKKKKGKKKAAASSDTPGLPTDQEMIAKLQLQKQYLEREVGAWRGPRGDTGLPPGRPAPSTPRLTLWLAPCANALLVSAAQYKDEARKANGAKREIEKMFQELKKTFGEDEEAK